jgi:acetoacetyl-CoA synthetase
MPDVDWFPGATLNYAEHVLRRGRDADVALFYREEGGPLNRMTRGQLRDEVARVPRASPPRGESRRPGGGIHSQRS